MAAPCADRALPRQEANTESNNQKRCYMHIISVPHERVNYFTAKRWDTYRRCLEMWLEVRGGLCDVAVKHTNCLQICFDDIPDDAGYHATCYGRFTDKTAIAKVGRRLTREREDAEKKAGKVQDVEATPTTSEAIIPPTTELRSRMLATIQHATADLLTKNAIAKVQRRRACHREDGQEKDNDDLESAPSTNSTSLNPTEKLQSSSGLQATDYVLPDVCIICNIKWKKMTRAGRRQREPLSKAKTSKGGKLLEAAVMKEDQRILLLLKDKDCTALEVLYHRSCFRDYTRIALECTKPQEVEDDPTFEVTYKVFCERFIHQRVLANQEMLKMGHLTKAFNKLLNADKDVDSPNYRQSMLRKKLRNDFPQLVFYCPIRRLELVFSKTLSTDAVVDAVPHPSDPMQMMSAADAATATTAAAAATAATAAAATRVDATDSATVAHLQCPLCGHFSKSHAHQLSHTANMHPTCLDIMEMGRLGRIFMYQSGGRLFHCAECFFTSRDFSKLYKHIITKHCECKEGGGEGAAELRDDGSEKDEEEEKQEKLEKQEEKATEGQGSATTETPEEVKIEPDENALMFDGGKYHCLICGWNNKLKSCSVSHLVRKHYIPKWYASQAIKFDTSGAGAEDEDATLSGDLLKEEVAATAKVVRFISNRFVCLICGWKTKLKGFAISHVVRTHKVERPYQCKECKRSFFLPSRLQQHVRLAHRPGRFACPFCSFRSQFMGGFRRHCSRCNAREEEEEEEEDEEVEDDEDDREEEGAEVKEKSEEETRGILTAGENTEKPIKEEEEEQEVALESEQRKQTTEKRAWTAMDEDEKGKETAGMEREKTMRLMNEGEEEEG